MIQGFPPAASIRWSALRRKLERAEVELVKVRHVIEAQGNVSALLGELLGPGGETSDESSNG